VRWLAYAPLGISVVAAVSRIAVVKRAALRAFGDIPDLIGREFDEVVHLLWSMDYADEITDVFRRTLRTGVPHFVAEQVEKRLDSGVTEFYEWQVHRIPLPDDRHGVVCYFRDISKTVTTREALREADARKDQFLATVSHELRSPLTPMVAALDLQRLARGDLARIDKARMTMERQVTHMIRLVDDLLDVSRITQDKIALVRNPLRVDELLQHAVDTVRGRIDGARQHLSVEPPAADLIVIGDRDRLGQVVANLLINASKYTPAEGRIELSATADDVRGSVVITVRDDGIGIAPELLPRVFDLFVQAREVVGRSDGGLGIGLNLVRKLVELHGGSVRIFSDGRGRGTEVRVQLPLVAAAS
jgi:signal transduction histidine kinase